MRARAVSKKQSRKARRVDKSPLLCGCGPRPPQLRLNLTLAYNYIGGRIFQRLMVMRCEMGEGKSEHENSSSVETASEAQDGIALAGLWCFVLVSMLAYFLLVYLNKEVTPAIAAFFPELY